MHITNKWVKCKITKTKMNKIKLANKEKLNNKKGRINNKDMKNKYRILVILMR